MFGLVISVVSCRRNHILMQSYKYSWICQDHIVQTFFFI
jgi:hypothetical protein